MATNDELGFELERRVIVLHRDTTMPDFTQLGFIGDPNLAILGNSDGEDLIFNCPASTKYHDKSINPEIVWEKVINISGGLWIQVSSGASNDIPNKTTKLTITSSTTSGSNFFTNSGGTYYTKSGDDGDLLNNSTLFLTNEKIQFYLNGSNLLKDVHITWTSSTSFNFNFDVDAGDFIKIIS